MHEVQIKVVGPKFLQSIFHGHFDVLWVVMVLEQLGGEKELLSRHPSFADTLANLSLVLITPRTAEARVKPAYKRGRRQGDEGHLLDMAVAALCKATSALPMIRANGARDLLTLIACSTAVATSPLLVRVHTVSWTQVLLMKQSGSRRLPLRWDWRCANMMARLREQRRHHISRMIRPFVG